MPYFCNAAMGAGRLFSGAWPPSKTGHFVGKEKRSPSGRYRKRSNKLLRPLFVGGIFRQAGITPYAGRAVAGVLQPGAGCPAAGGLMRVKKTVGISVIARRFFGQLPTKYGLAHPEHNSESLYALDRGD
jgi:hypothetical protein